MNLIKSEPNQIDLTLQAAKIGTWYWDLITNEVVWDEQTHKVFGVEFGSFAGNFEAFASCVHPEDLELLNSQINNSLVNNKPYALDFRVVKPNRELIHLNAKGTVYKDSTGKVIKVIGIVWDITKDKLAQEELIRVTKFRQAILDSSDYMIISTDVNGTITSYNKAAERLLEYSAEEMVGKQTPAIIHDFNEVAEHAKKLNDEYGFNLEPGFEVFIAKSKYLNLTDTKEWTYLSKSGRRFPVLLSVTALKDNNDNIIGYLGIVKDITSDRQKDVELEKKTLELERSNIELEHFAYM